MDRVSAITDYIFLGGIAGVRKEFLLDNNISLIINGKVNYFQKRPSLQLSPSSHQYPINSPL
jgi:hypothetical protein